MDPPAVGPLPGLAAYWKAVSTLITDENCGELEPFGEHLHRALRAGSGKRGFEGWMEGAIRALQVYGRKDPARVIELGLPVILTDLVRVFPNCTTLLRTLRDFMVATRAESDAVGRALRDEICAEVSDQISGEGLEEGQEPISFEVTEFARVLGSDPKFPVVLGDLNPKAQAEVRRVKAIVDGGVVPDEEKKEDKLTPGRPPSAAEAPDDAVSH
jgi:hypothetical protein